MSAPVFELLLASARTVPDSARIQQLTEQNIDWKTFWDLVTHYSVRPLVLRSMQMTSWSRVPEQSQREWQQAVRTIAGRHLFLSGELIRIVRALETAGVEVCVLKGLFHGQILYGDILLRETSDFDLLIREEHLRTAAGVFRELGYAPRDNTDLDELPELLKYVGEYLFVGHGTLVDIDLHWRFSNKPLALAPEWSDFPLTPQPFELSGSNVHGIAIHELPLYLAAQGGNDSWTDLRRICDLAEYLRRYPNTDWARVMHAARRHHAERVLLVGVQLAVTLLGVNRPPGLSPQSLNDAIIVGLAARIAQRMRQHNLPGVLERHLFQLKAKDGPVEKMNLLWSILTNRMMADARWIRLPRPLWWCYRVLRPMRMALKLGSTDEN